MTVRRDVQGTKVRAVDRHPAAGRVVEACHQLDQGRLARAGLADEGDRLTGGDPEVDAAQRLLVLPVLEVHVLERHLAPQRQHLQRVLGRLRRGRLLEEFLDAAERDRGLLVAVEDLGELLDRGEEQVDVEQVRHQRAGRQRRRLDPGAAHDQHRRRGPRRQELHEGEVDRDQPLTPDAGLAVAVTALGEPRAAVPLAPEGLHDPQPGHRLLEVGVDQRHPLTGEFVRLHARPAEEVGADDQRRQGREDDERQLEVEHQQGDHDAEEGDDGDEGRDQARLEERRQRVDVRRHPGHDPAGQLPLVVVESEPLKLGEDLQTEGVQDALSGAPGHPRLADLGHPLDGDGEQGEEGRRPDRAEGDLRDARVDAVPDQDGEEEPHAGVHGDQAEADQERQPEASQQPFQAVRLLRAHRARLVDVGGVGRRGQRLHLGEELGGRRGLRQRQVLGLAVTGPQPRGHPAFGVELGVQFVAYGGVLAGAGGLGMAG